MNVLFKGIFTFLMVCSLSLVAQPAEAKRFKRALIIAGGGISPALSLGVLRGMEEAGVMPYVVITTCGASLGAAIYNSYLNAPDSLAYAMSPSFHQGLRQIRINNGSLLDISDKFSSIQKNLGLVPDFFNGYILDLPASMKMDLANTQFNSSNHRPRIVMVAAKALFGRESVGGPRPAKMFTETFFTDADTAQALKGFKSPLAKLSPSYVTAETQVITSKTTEEAMRASVSDPYLINPAVLDGSYYFTGAVDLFPVELAQYLADEVIVTYPVSLFDGPMDVAFSTAFGYTQTYRTLQVLQDKTVKWIDMAGADSLKFDPSPVVLTIANRIPSNLAEYQRGLLAQYEFGRTRTLEGLRVQPQVQTREHLREPINPKLYEDFTCDNANAWTTWETPRLCTVDYWAGCSRKSKTCRPVR